MRNKIKPYLRAMVAVTATIAAAGCTDEFLEVTDPTVIDASTIDPVQDLPTFAASGLQNLFDAFDDAVVYSGWFSGEIWVGDTFPTRNDIGRRVVEFTNGTLLADLYEPLSLAISSNERVQELVEESGVTSDEVLATASLASGYSIVLMAESFCEVVISSSLDNLGSPISPDAAMSEAIERFDRAIAAGTAAGEQDLVNAARVGKARALLSIGQFAEASQVATQVPGDLEFVAPKVDDPSFRARLGNTVFSFTLARPSIVTPPYYRALDDPRIEFALLLGPDGQPLKSQGNNLDFFAQTKYPEYGAPLRIASGLEARYIHAEAQLKLGNAAPAEALIAERRIPTAADGDEIDFVASTGTLVQLLDQKARDFWLEAVHMGDWQRNPDSTPYVPPAGAPYYGELGGEFGELTCLPTPRQEVLNNPNYGG